MYCICSSWTVNGLCSSSFLKKNRIIEKPISTRKPDDIITMAMIAPFERLALVVPSSLAPRANKACWLVVEEGMNMAIFGRFARGLG